MRTDVVVISLEVWLQTVPTGCVSVKRCPLSVRSGTLC